MRFQPSRSIPLQSYSNVLLTSRNDDEIDAGLNDLTFTLECQMAEKDLADKRFNAWQRKQRRMMREAL